MANSREQTERDLADLFALNAHLDALQFPNDKPTAKYSSSDYWNDRDDDGIDQGNGNKVSLSALLKDASSTQMQVGNPPPTFGIPGSRSLLLAKSQSPSLCKLRLGTSLNVRIPRFAEREAVNLGNGREAQTFVRIMDEHRERGRHYWNSHLPPYEPWHMTSEDRDSQRPLERNHWINRMEHSGEDEWHDYLHYHTKHPEKVNGYRLGECACLDRSPYVGPEPELMKPINVRSLTSHYIEISSDDGSVDDTSDSDGSLHTVSLKSVKSSVAVVVAVSPASHHHAQGVTPVFILGGSDTTSAKSRNSQDRPHATGRGRRLRRGDSSHSENSLRRRYNNHRKRPVQEETPFSVDIEARRFDDECEIGCMDTCCAWAKVVLLGTALAVTAISVSVWRYIIR